MRVGRPKWLLLLAGLIVAASLVAAGLGSGVIDSPFVTSITATPQPPATIAMLPVPTRAPTSTPTDAAPGALPAEDVPLAASPTAEPTTTAPPPTVTPSPSPAAEADSSGGVMVEAIGSPPPTLIAQAPAATDTAMPTLAAPTIAAPTVALPSPLPSATIHIASTLPATSTPAPTRTATLVATAAQSPTPTITLTPTVPTPLPTFTPAPFPFIVQPGTPRIRENFQNGRGCEWQGIAGTVVTNRGEHLVGLEVRLADEEGSQSAASGDAAAYGRSGWEIATGEEPAARQLQVALWDNGVQVSPSVLVTLGSDCQSNLALVNFVKVR